MEESGNTKAIQPDTPKTSSFRLELPPCCNSTWAAVDVSLSSAQCPIPFPLGTSSWLGTCTVADGTAKFSFQPDQLPGGVCNRARHTLELAYGKWEPPLVPAAEALVTLRPLWKAHCPAQVSCRLLPAEGATSSHPQEWMSLTPAPPTSTQGQDLSPSWGAAAAPPNPSYHRDKPLEERPRRIIRTQHRKNYSSKSHFYLLCSPLPRGISSGHSSWQLLKQTWCSAAEGFLKIQSE